MTPREAQAGYVEADEKFQAHKRTCPVCGNPRLRDRCQEGDSLREAALAKRQAWADAVAAAREEVRR
jgi:hypothetical protein